MENKMKVAALQLGPYRETYQQNMGSIIKIAKEVIEKENPDLLVCSELMTAPYFAAVSQTNDKYFEYAEFMSGKTVEIFCELAKETKTHIVGTLFEKELDNNVMCYYNTAFVCSPTKGLIGKYRKVHVPKVHVDSLDTDEKYYFERLGGGGTDFPVFTLDNGWKMGILICFDRSFSEAWRSLAVQGVDLIVVPTATYGFRKSLYVEELQVRALENNIYVMGVNKAGLEQLIGEPIERNHFGLSCVIDPLGEKLVVADESEWTYITSNINLNKIKESKDRVDWLASRKIDIYDKYLKDDSLIKDLS